MTQPLFLNRTIPFKDFQSKIGFSVANLNTLIVGLTAIRSGVAQKPSSLAVSWSGKNPEFLATEARQFATKSLMVYAVDALDKYIENVGSDRCLITDDRLQSILLGEPQISTPRAKHIPPSEIAELKNALNDANADAIIDAIQEFNRRFGGKKRPPHLRTQFDALSAKFPAPAYYLAAVRLLVSWRNRHVHRSDESISKNDEIELLDSKSIFWNEHSHTDISLMLQHYSAAAGPSLKDISTLLSVLQRTVRVIDEKIVDSCSTNEFAIQALQKALQKAGDAKDRQKKLWGLDSKTRQRKLFNYLLEFGFQPNRRQNGGQQLSADFVVELAALDRSQAAAHLQI